MNLNKIQEKLKKMCSENFNVEDFSEIILTINENYGNEISLMTIGCNNTICDIFDFFFNVTEKYNITNKDEYLLDALKLDSQKNIFNVIYFDGTFLSDDIKYFILSISYSVKNSIFIFNNLTLESRNLSEMLKLSNDLTHIIDLKDSSIFIKKPNFRMITYKDLSDFSLKASGYRPDNETLDNVMNLLNSFTQIKIKENLNIEITSFINISEVICVFEDNKKNQLYKTTIYLKNGIKFFN